MKINENFPHRLKAENTGNGLHEIDAPDYFEWWYFDIITEDNIIIIFEFHASNLANRDNVPQIVVSVYWPTGQTVKRQERLPRKRMMYSKDGCAIRYSDHRIAENKNELALNWEVQDIKLSVTFSKQNPDLVPCQTELVKNLKNQNFFNWLVLPGWLPTVGRLTLGNQTINCAGRGYHDHNWGNLKLNAAISRWTWGRIAAEPLWLAFGHIQPHQTDYVGQMKPILFLNQGVICSNFGFQFITKRIIFPNLPDQTIDLIAEISFSVNQVDRRITFKAFNLLDSVKFLFPNPVNSLIRTGLLICYYSFPRESRQFHYIEKILQSSVYYRFTARYEFFENDVYRCQGMALLEQIHFAK